MNTFVLGNLERNAASVENSGIRMNMEHFFQWFVPDHLIGDIDQYQKAHLIVRFCWYGLPFFLFNNYKWLWLGVGEMAGSLAAVTFIIMLMPFVLRYTGSTRMAGNGILAALCSHFIYLAYHTGGISSHALSWILVIPIFSMMLIHARDAIIWSVSMAAVILAFYVMAFFSHKCPDILYGRNGVLVHQLSSAFGPFLAVTILGGIVKTGINRAINAHNEAVKMREKAQNLENLFVQVQRSGLQVTSSANQLLAVAKHQEMTMERQMKSIGAVLDGVEEISRVTTELFKTMQTVATVSQETARFAGSGKSELISMEGAMGDMETSSRLISKELKTISEKAENITAVITTITKVADQTNLLSLNAAIEAEKAGEYGRGFNVVSREIRRLADRTAVATLDIEQMIQEMQSAVSASVNAVKTSISDVQNRSRDVDTISTHLTCIIEQVQELTPRFDRVNESMGIQSKNAVEVRDSMAGLKSEMEQLMASTRESYLAIEQLNEAVRDLNKEVSRYNSKTVDRYSMDVPPMPSAT